MKKLIFFYSLVLIFSLAVSASTSATPPEETVVVPTVEENIKDQVVIEDQILVQLDQYQDINYDIELRQLEAELN